MPSPHAIEQAVSEAMQLIAELPEDDQRLKHDTIEGETRYFAVLDDLAEQALADARLVELAKERIKRLEARAERHRNIICRMLEVVELNKAERPLYTASISYHRELVLVDEERVPDDFVRTSLDRPAIAKALRSGHEVRGAELGNAQPRLTLRTA